jgi:endoglycosylceramidase
VGGTWPCRRQTAATLLSVFALLAVLAPRALAGTPSPPAPALSWLSTDNTRYAIQNAAGDQVLLRGVNVNQLGSYYQGDPSLPTVEPLTEDDFAQMASLGFDVVRLVISWSSLEPSPGVIDGAYLARIHQAVAWAGDNGLYVVLDMHQDAWGQAIASPPGTACPAPLQPAIGWDGAPAWATITDDLTTCRLDQREIAPAVADAWQHFWLDTDGIQDQLVDTWAAVARSFAADPTVAGYDLLNEPNPGFVPAAGPTDADLLGRFYAGAISAIRAAEQSVPGGHKHIVFFEPSITWDLTGTGLAPLPGFTADNDIAFAPHLYDGSLSADVSAGLPSVLSVQDGFQQAETWAQSYHIPLWAGEWGWFGDPTADAADVATFGQQEDTDRIGGAWWDWKQACGDPHQIGTPGAAPAPVSPSLNRYACPSGASLGRPAPFTEVLSSAYPMVTQDTLDSLSSDPASGTLTMVGQNVQPGDTVIWAPTGRWGATPPTVTGTYIDHVSTTRVPGGWIVTVAVKTILAIGSSHYTLTLTR